MVFPLSLAPNRKNVLPSGKEPNLGNIFLIASGIQEYIPEIKFNKAWGKAKL
jgi:hypothetical protein